MAQQQQSLPAPQELSNPNPTIQKTTTTPIPSTTAPETIAPLAQQDQREVSPQGRYVKLEDRLGTGAYKEVWRAYDTNDGIEVAWNVVKLARIPPPERKRIKTEVKLLKDIEHKNVIRYFNSWVNREKEQIVFVTEIMSSGSLKDYLRKNTMIRWMAIKRWCVQILTGLAFLHENHIIHRDIKCDNIFINGSTGDIRIGDLGLSTRITEARLPAFNTSSPSSSSTNSSAPSSTATTSSSAQKYPEITATTMTCLGTPEFMAPEMYEESYDEKVDIYAFGMCILEMVTGLLPYHHCASAVQIYRKVLNGELPPELELIEQSNVRAHSFVNACLLPKSLRPSAVELLQHTFLQPNEDEDLCEVRPKALRHMPIVEEEEDGEESDAEGSGGEDVKISAKSVPSPHSPEKGYEESPVKSEQAAYVAAAQDIPGPPPPPSETPRTTASGEHGQYQIEEHGSGGPTRVRRTVLAHLGSPTGDGTFFPSPVLGEHDSKHRGSSLGEVPLHSGSPSGGRFAWEKVSSGTFSALAESTTDAQDASTANPVTVFDVQDHESLPDTLVFYLRIQQSPSDRSLLHETPSENKTGPEETQLEIEFEFDLLNDDVGSIAEEMLQLDDLKHRTCVTCAHLVQVFEPLVSAARQLLSSAAPSSGPGGASDVRSESAFSIHHTFSDLTVDAGDFPSSAPPLPPPADPSSLALSTMMRVMRDENGANPAYRMLKRKVSTRLGINPNASAVGVVEEALFLSASVSDGVEASDSAEVGGAEVQDETQTEEYKLLLFQHSEFISRLEKEHVQRLAGLAAQKAKAQLSHERDRDGLLVRRDDLNAQLDEMQRKYRERMTEFSARKNRALEAHLDSEQRQKELHSQVSSHSLHAESVDSHSPIPHANGHAGGGQPIGELSSDKNEATQPKTETLV